MYHTEGPDAAVNAGRGEPYFFRAPARRPDRAPCVCASVRRGTRAPLSLASLNPIAIACARLRTVAPDPLLSVPRLRRRIAEATLFDAFFP